MLITNNLLWALETNPTSMVGVDSIMKWLAILGGAALGALLVGFIANRGTKLLTTKDMPVGALRVTRLTGGLTAGILVGLYVYGSGGGFGWGTGSGDGDGPGTGKNNNTPSNKENDPNNTNQTVKVPDDGVLEVVVLAPTPGVEAQEDNPFRVLDKTRRYTMAELKSKLIEAKDEKLKKVRFYTYTNSAKGNQLDDYVKELGKALKIPVTVTDDRFNPVPN